MPITWTKSSYSTDTDNCVEFAEGPNPVPVRDSKRPEGPHLAFPRDSWTTFVDALKGEATEAAR
ncbi:DUF397 domain-containing protein [Streptomyces sp. NPDC001941]|uniref:DUF397 domain-containing protein n=1 Tax=Streptomyces sp. NPDC001941 TaxID=3154659 RepID=UPI00333262D0